MMAITRRVVNIALIALMIVWSRNIVDESLAQTIVPAMGGQAAPISSSLTCTNTSTDAAAIQAALNAASTAGGGKVTISPTPTCFINTTLTVATPQVGIECSGYAKGSANSSTPTPACKFLWGGSASGTIMSIIAPTGSTADEPLFGNFVKGISFLGNGGLAANGLVLQTVSHSTFEGLYFAEFNGGTALDVNVVNANTSTFAPHVDSQNNIFRSISINQYVGGTVDGTSSYSSRSMRLGMWVTQASPFKGGNASFNLFEDIDIWGGSNGGILMDGVDNNTFIDSRIEPAAGPSVDFSIHCNSGACYPANANTFIDLSTPQASRVGTAVISRGTTTFSGCTPYTDTGFAVTSCTGQNTIYQLDASNGSAHPIQEAGSQLWFSQSGQGHLQTAGTPVFTASSPCTGLGSSGTCAFTPNTVTDQTGQVVLTPGGTGIAATGTIAIDLSATAGSTRASSGTPIAACVVQLRGVWAANSTASVGYVGPLQPDQSFTILWTNITTGGTATALTSGQPYYLVYHCMGI